MFNKIFIFFTFFIISFHLLSRTLSQTQHKPKITHTQPPPSKPTHQPTHPATTINPQSSTTITPQKIQTEIPNPIENRNSKSKPHRKSRPLNPIINDSHRLNPWWCWSSRPRPHTKTPWHRRRHWSCPSSNELRPPCLINSLSPSLFPNELLDRRGWSAFPTHSPPKLADLTQFVVREISAELSSSSPLKPEILKKKEKLIGFAELRWEIEKAVMKWERES